MAGTCLIDRTPDTQYTQSQTEAMTKSVGVPYLFESPSLWELNVTVQMWS